MSEHEVFAPYHALEKAVRACASERSVAHHAESTDHDTHRCACGPFLTPGASGTKQVTNAQSDTEGRRPRPTSPATQDDQILWHEVWAQSNLFDACSDGVRSRFEALYLALQSAGNDIVIAPYEVLLAAVESCTSETYAQITGADATSLTATLRSCACGPFDPSSDSTKTTKPHEGNVEAISRKVLAKHLRMNGKL
jgi:hypothetical protein